MKFLVSQLKLCLRYARNIGQYFTTANFQMTRRAYADSSNVASDRRKTLCRDYFCDITRNVSEIQNLPQTGSRVTATCSFKPKMGVRFLAMF